MQTNERRSDEVRLDEFAESRGFVADELARWGITTEGDVVYIPILHRHAACPSAARGHRCDHIEERTWVRVVHRPGGSPKYRPEVPGMGKHLYNPMGLGPGTDVVWLAEGEFDTLSLVTVGAPAVGVGGASSFKTAWARLYRNALVIVAFDPDTESKEQAERVGQLMQQFPRVKRFDPYEIAGYDDLNDWFTEDRAGFKAAVVRETEGAY